MRRWSLFVMLASKLWPVGDVDFTDRFIISSDSLSNSVESEGSDDTGSEISEETDEDSDEESDEDSDEESEETFSESLDSTDVSFVQFAKAAVQAHKELVIPTFDDMVKFVRSYDDNKDGFLTVLEIKQLLNDSEEKLSDADYFDILEECGADPDDIYGKVEIGKLVRVTYNLKD
ncbi:hypothetical protein WDU94_004172 [Cyamophila willieti]